MSPMNWAGGLGYGLLAFALWIILDKILYTPAAALQVSSSQTDWFQNRGSMLIRFLGSGVTVPLYEELAFRGYLMRWVSSGVEFGNLPFIRSSWAGIALSSLAFGLLHPQALAATLCGVIFGFAAKSTNSLSTAVIAHASCNIFIAISATLLNWRHLWA